MSQSQISIRRQHMHSSIRKEAIRVHMQKVRQQLLTQQRHQIIDKLIQKDENLNNEQLLSLIYFASQQQSNAIIHIGNLIIDQKINIKKLYQNLKLGKNDYWCWLIRVLASKGYWNGNYIEYSIEKLMNKKSSNYILDQCLNYIQFLIRQHQDEVIPILSNHQNFLFQLLKLSENNFKSIYTLSVSILAKIVSYSSSSAQSLINYYEGASLYTIKTLSKYFQRMLMKSQSLIRCLAIQILTNLAENSIILADTMFFLLDNSLMEKQKVKIQISFYWRIIFLCSQDNVLLCLLDRSIIRTIKQYLESQNQQIRKNAKECAQQLLRRVSKWDKVGEIIWQRLVTERIIHLIDQRRMDLEH